MNFSSAFYFRIFKKKHIIFYVFWKSFIPPYFSWIFFFTCIYKAISKVCITYQRYIKGNLDTNSSDGCMAAWTCC